MPLAVLKVVTLLRIVAFMVVVYMLLGWWVERKSVKPDSKLRAFFRTLCSPVTRLVAPRVRPGSSPERVMAIGTAVAGGLWVALAILEEILFRMQ